MMTLHPFGSTFGTVRKALRECDDEMLDHIEAIAAKFEPYEVTRVEVAREKERRASRS